MRMTLKFCATFGAVIFAMVATGGEERFEYDALGRLNSVTYVDNTRESFTLDPAGNRTTVAVETTPSVPVPLSAGVSSTTWSWFAELPGGSTIVSPPVTVSVSGGASPYVYAWQRVSGDTQTTVVNPTSASTTWSRTVSSYWTDYTSVWRCKVTDSAGTVVYSPNVTVNFRKETSF
jgi:YD repeat-containing protein